MTGADWSNAANLQDALTSSVSGDEIWVVAGNYFPGNLETDTFTISENVTLLGGFNGTETSSSQRDWTVHQTILSGEIQNDANNTNNSDSVVTFTGNHITFSSIPPTSLHGKLMVVQHRSPLSIACLMPFLKAPLQEA
jgi:hypothetical protein